MLRVAVGHSADPDSRVAVRDVLEQCQRSLVGAMPQAAILLAAIDFDHALILQEINQCFPDIELIGGTTDGELSSVLGFQQDSLTLMLFCASTIEIRAGLGHPLSANPVAATRQAIEQAMAQLHQPPQLCLTTPESFTASGVSIVNGLKQALGPQVPIFGGLTADQWQCNQWSLNRTHQFYRTQVYSDAVPVLLFAGNIHFACGVASGWQPVGKQGQVTKAAQNIVYEIDGKAAIDFYHHYLGESPPSPEYPLAVFDPSGSNFYMRAPSAVGEGNAGSITFFGDIAEGAIVQLAESTRSNILAAAKTATQQALATYTGEAPAAALFFSCGSRRQILGPQASQEYVQVSQCLSAPLPSCGFYTNGEIAPFELTGETQFHNETFITLLMGSR